MEAASALADKPLRRLLAYMRLAPGAYALGGVLTLHYALFFQLIPLSIRRIVAAFENAPDEVGRAILGLVAASVCLALARLFSRIVMFNIGRQIEFRIRNDYFAHLQSLPQSFYLAHRTGDLMSRAVNDINSIRMFLGMGLLNLLQTPVLFAGALIVLL
ncbi:MAG: ABC transporter transmembrane domain-containing protein, partial [Acidobacteria bacterium]|nr:ABC transporter transmembrane domain-containing protein [Acidobacteriota bacterium]